MKAKIQEAALAGVSKALGDSCARALGFYAGYDVIERDPGLFDAMLRRVLPVGTEVVEGMIVREVFLMSGMAFDGGLGFAEAIEAATDHDLSTEREQPAPPSSGRSPSQDRLLNETCERS